VIGRPEIARLSRAGQVDERTQERDYVLTWLLAAFSVRDSGLVFKGGTCLRRCYIPGYRYSEDLDFTLAPAAEETMLADAVASWCRWIESEAGIRADALADGGAPSTRAWVSFTGPLGARRERAIKVDLADDEVVVDVVEHRPLSSEYSDLPDGMHVVPCYSLAEIWAEKTRSLMQRAEPRDLYDLAFLAGEYRDLPAVALPLFGLKATAKGLDPRGLGDRLDAREATMKRMWDARLRDQVADVPDFEATWRVVRRALRQGAYMEHAQ
jgi:uncharacterized protein